MRYLLIVLILFLSSCGFYSFSGSSIPSHMKTIEIPLFENASYKQLVAEDITDKVIGLAQKERLKLVSSEGDASLEGKLLSYDNRADDYSGSRSNLQVKSYAVTMTVEVTFKDKVKDKVLYTGTVSAKGIYDFDSESEEIGIRRAVDEIAQKIMNNSLPGW